MWREEEPSQLQQRPKQDRRGYVGRDSMSGEGKGRASFGMEQDVD
jgi:hypothetical protein